MKQKVLDYDTDWKRVIDEELAFMVNENMDVGTDYRYATVKKEGEVEKKPTGPKVDPREGILKGLVQNLGHN